MLEAIRINQDGELSIKRKGVFVVCECLYVCGNKCAHYCPMFGEPQTGLRSAITTLELCDIELETGEFIDDRQVSYEL